MATTDQPYLDLVASILADGEDRGDRTGVGTRSLFGSMMRFSLRDNQIPLLTVRKIYWKGVVEELLWFIRGQTNAKELSAKGVRIWEGNSSRQFLEKRGLDYDEGDIGPMYGFQWRHWGAEYRGCDAEYGNQGIDQLANIIEEIKRDPTSRRLVLSSWNVADLDKMVLAPCHVLFQLQVSADRKELSGLLYQRSCDVGLGAPFNIASYALLTHLIAAMTGLTAKELVYTTGDTHIYASHIEAMTELATRPAREFPRLVLKREVKTLDDCSELTLEDCVLVGYEPFDPIKMEMAV